jgi:predicted N-formylglutamate amidohydrolase
MNKYRNALNGQNRDPYDVQLQKCRKILRKLEKQASKNSLAAVRMDRMAKKYEATLSKIHRLAGILNPVGVR